MLSHVRRERFLVITLPAVENKRSGAAEVAGIASTRLAKTPKVQEVADFSPYYIDFLAKNHISV